MVENHFWIVGNPEDCVAGIKRLQEVSGGFGGFLATSNEWTTREKSLRSYELMARHVIPQFQGSVVGLAQSQEWAASKRVDLQDARAAALKKADVEYHGGPKPAP